MTRFNTRLSIILLAGAVVGSALAAASPPARVDPVPCEAWAQAVIANTGGVIDNAQTLVDSYSSALGPYGGANVGSDAVVQAATTVTNNGGVVHGKVISKSPTGLAVVAVPPGAKNLPLGSSSPGSLNVNDAGSSLTLAPGDYVASNINVNFPGSITISPVGRVRIWVTGNLNLGGNENLNGVPNNLAFLVTRSGFVNVNGNGSLFGLIYAPTSVVNADSAIFGSVVGSSVALNSKASVHFDDSSVCNPAISGGGPPPPVATHPPHVLPLPPKTQGCYQGTANGWVPITCATPGTTGPILSLTDAIQTPNGASSTIPFQFGQVETTLTAYASESDSLAGANSLSLQGNTAPFNGTNGHSDWVQFVIQPSGTNTILKLETWNLDTFYGPANQVCPNNACVISCGCTDFGVTNVPSRGTFNAFDSATVAGSTYTDNTGAAVIGMVAQFSWFDPNHDPNNNRGLYAIVATDQYGLASNWNEFSGTLFGYGGSSTANFQSSSVLTRTLVGSCVNGTPPLDGIPWPGTCTGSANLLPDTTQAQHNRTGETSNLCEVGSATPLLAANTNLVFSDTLTSTSCSPPSCISTSSQLFVRSTDEDTGVRPINVGTTPFWASPDLFLVPAGSTVDVNAVSTETLVTPGDSFDVWVRVNNDYGCNPVTGAKALVYLADPSALSTAWTPISGGMYEGSTDPTINPGGVTVAAGGRNLIGPFRFNAPTTGFGNGHKCLLAAIQATGEVGPSNTTDPLSSAQVGQRNVQFSNCELPLTNATTSNGNVTITITAVGAAPSLTGGNDIQVSFDDPSQAFLTQWQPASGAAYSVSSSAGQTVVRLGPPAPMSTGQTSVTLAPVPIAAGQTVTASASVSLALGQPDTTLQVQAVLTDATTGAQLVANGVSCVGTAPAQPPPPPPIQ